jgi:hypothetical protein
MTPMNRSVLEVAEYEHLKKDQRMHSIENRRIILTVLIYTGAALALASDPKYSSILLLVPIVCLALGWLYIRNEQKITEIDRYLAIYPECKWNRTTPEKTFEHKVIALAIHLLLFVFTGVGSIIAYVLIPGIGWSAIVAGLELIMLNILAGYLVHNSGLFTKTISPYIGADN